MLVQSVLNAARPYLEGRKVKDAVIGISLIAVELDNGHVGVSYVLREDLEAGCSIFPYGREVVGRPAEEIARWAASGGDSLQRGIGIAVLAAASRSQALSDCDSPDRPFGVTLRPTDKVGMIGLIAPVIKMMGPRVAEICVFDKGVSMLGSGGAQVLPVESQSQVLPTCDVVVISGTSMINGSIDGLLEMCGRAREIVMIGSSTPMFPAAFKGSRVTVLAGSWWKSENKEEIFRNISLACGISALGAYSIKKSVRVE